MRRRDFIMGIAGSAAWPVGARAQQPTIPVIGYLSLAPLATSVVLRGFQRGLNETGWIEGSNVTIDYRSANGRMGAISGLAADLIRRGVNVMFVVGGEPTVLAVKAATATIPIVFSAIDDPVRLGLVSSFNRPGGNLTGASLFHSETNAKRMDLLHDLVPQATAIGLLVWPIPDIDAQTAHATMAARAFGITLHVIDVEREGGIDRAYASLLQRKVSALMVHPTSSAMFNRHQLVAASARHNVPTIYPARDFVLAGGLIGYGVNFTEAGRQGGIYTGRILKGEKVGDLPIQRPTKFDFAINLKTAMALGIEFTPKLLALAEEVIE